MRSYVTTNYYDVRCNCGPFISGRDGVKDNLHLGLPLSSGDFKRDIPRTLRGIASREGIASPVLVMHREGQLLNCRSIGERAVR